MKTYQGRRYLRAMTLESGGSLIRDYDSVAESISRMRSAVRVMTPVVLESLREFEALLNRVGRKDSIDLDETLL